jgi:hypothetical protein
MSTYYALFCQQCSDSTDFVSRGDGFTWMADAVTEVPQFLARHADHLSAIQIISEFDERWGPLGNRHERDRGSWER